MQPRIRRGSEKRKIGGETLVRAFCNYSHDRNSLSIKLRKEEQEDKIKQEKKGVGVRKGKQYVQEKTVSEKEGMFKCYCLKIT